jgi:putative salt-induced outer membrane protein
MLDQAPPPPSVQAPAPAAAIPADLKAMLDAAIADGDAKTIAKLFDYAGKARPDLAPALAEMRGAWQKQVDARQAEAEEATQRRLADAGPLDLWSGQVEFGASWSTGPTDNLGALASIDLKRDGIDWSHRLQFRGEIQDTDGVRAVERLLGSWQPRYATSPKSYVFGLGQFEHDPALGYDQRYTAGLGAGWSLGSGKKLKLALEGGPAIRHTVSEGEEQTRFAGRGTLDLGLAIGPRLDFTQRVSVFYEAGTSSGLLSSALDSKISDKLKLRLSYEYRIEEDGLRGVSTSGSVSRASLVYKL